MNEPANRRGSAKAMFQDGNLVAARHSLDATSDPSPKQIELMAKIDYLEGRYADAVGRLQALQNLLHPMRRHRIKRALSLAYYQTNQFEEAATLSLQDPYTALMRSFSIGPYLITWGATRRAELPFLQQEDWELPRVEITVNGTRLNATIDTGGDLLSFPWSLKEELGIEAISSFRGWFAGGQHSRTGLGKIGYLELGDLAIHNVPVSLNSLGRPVIGTGLLRQFLATLDYPGRRLILTPRGSRQVGPGIGIPFWLASTHLLIADGRLNGTADMKLLVDSGLETDTGAAFLAPDRTLAAAGIPTPPSIPVEGQTGAGVTHLDIGIFPVDELSLGTTTRRGLTGLTGVFPEQLSRARPVGFPLDGLVSHGFLRHYRWTLDFDRMSMALEVPDIASMPPS